MGNTITEPVMPNDITTHRTVGGGVKVHVGTAHVHDSLCARCTSFVLDAVQNQCSNSEREDNDASHNSNVEQNCGNCKSTRNTHTYTLKIQVWTYSVSGCTHTQIHACIQCKNVSKKHTHTHIHRKDSGMDVSGCTHTQICI